jgi:hypothetical protein
MGRDAFFVPDPQVVTKVHTYNRNEMRERGRKGGLTKAENARQRDDCVVVSAEQWSALWRILLKPRPDIFDEKPATDQPDGSA